MWHYLHCLRSQNAVGNYVMLSHGNLFHLTGPLSSQSLVDSLYKGPVMQSFAIFCLLTLIRYSDVPWICLYGTIFIIGYQKTVSTLRCCLTTIGIPILKTRWTHDHLIFMMEIPIPGKTIFYIETWPSWCKSFIPASGPCTNWLGRCMEPKDYIDDLVQGCSISSALAIDILQSSTKPLIYLLFCTMQIKK